MTRHGATRNDLTFGMLAPYLQHSQSLTGLVQLRRAHGIGSEGLPSSFRSPFVGPSQALRHLAYGFHASKASASPTEGDRTLSRASVAFQEPVEEDEGYQRLDVAEVRISAFKRAFERL